MNNTGFKMKIVNCLLKPIYIRIILIRSMSYNLVIQEIEKPRKKNKPHPKIRNYSTIW